MVWRTKRPGRPQRAQRSRTQRLASEASASTASSGPAAGVTVRAAGEETMPQSTGAWEV